MTTAVHMMHSLQYYMKSGQPTQRLGQDDSRKSTQHHLKSLSACFRKYMDGQASFEAARDAIRHELHSQSPDEFPHMEPEAQCVQL